MLKRKEKERQFKDFIFIGFFSLRSFLTKEKGFGVECTHGM